MLVFIQKVISIFCTFAKNFLIIMSSKPQEMFTHPVGNGMVCYVEREVDKFDYEGFEIVPREMFQVQERYDYRRRKNFEIIKNPNYDNLFPIR